MSTRLTVTGAIAQPTDLVFRIARLRQVRFAFSGGVGAVVQLGILKLLEALGAPALLANAVGFLVSAQVNFFLNLTLTWGDRRSGGDVGQSLLRRWLRFHGAIAGTGLLNLGVFTLARVFLPDLLASALGIGVAAVANFLLADRLVFRAGQSRTVAMSPGGRPTRLVEAQRRQLDRQRPYQAVEPAVPDPLRSKAIPAAVVLLALLDGALHLTLDFVLFRGRLFANTLSEEFLLNFVGYLVLAGLFLWGPRLIGGRRWLVDVVMILYVGVAAVAWWQIGRPNPDGLGYLSKGIEIALAVCLFADMRLGPLVPPRAPALSRVDAD